jgi:hypothetical protein
MLSGKKRKAMLLETGKEDESDNKEPKKESLRTLTLK